MRELKGPIAQTTTGAQTKLEEALTANGASPHPDQSAKRFAKRIGATPSPQERARHRNRAQKDAEQASPGKHKHFLRNTVASKLAQTSCWSNRSCLNSRKLFQQPSAPFFAQQHSSQSSKAVKLRRATTDQPARGESAHTDSSPLGPPSSRRAGPLSCTQSCRSPSTHLQLKFTQRGAALTYADQPLSSLIQSNSNTTNLLSFPFV